MIFNMTILLKKKNINIGKVEVKRKKGIIRYLYDNMNLISGFVRHSILLNYIKWYAAMQDILNQYGNIKETTCR